MHDLSLPNPTDTYAAPEPGPMLAVEHGPEALGDCYVERLDCEAGFSVVRSHILPTKALSETYSYEGKERNLVVAFGLTGESEFQDKRGDRLTFSADHTTASIFQAGSGERRHAAGRLVRQLRLVVSESALMRYVGPERCRQLLGPALGRGEGFRQIAFSASAASPHLRSFCDPNLFAQEDGLSLRIHALSLLAEQLRALAPPLENTGRLSARDTDKMAHVEDFMRAHMSQPLNNMYLCTALGISEYKLKEGFRQVYGTSPGQRLLELRMHRAQELLETGCQVAEAAYRVGYQHPSNFSAAFTRFFGRTPKSVLGKRSRRASQCSHQPECVDHE